MTGPGPSNVSQKVLQAQALPTLGHLHPEFTKIMDDIKAGVRYIFQTSNPMTLALSATGHAAMECVMTNLLEPGRTVLICNSGIWGVRSANMARRQGATVKEITAEAGTNFRLDQIETAVKVHKPDLVFLTHGESSTGVLQPLEGIGAMCRPRLPAGRGHGGQPGRGAAAGGPAADRRDLHRQPEGARGSARHRAHLLQPPRRGELQAHLLQPLLLLPRPVLAGRVL